MYKCFETYLQVDTIHQQTMSGQTAPSQITSRQTASFLSDSFPTESRQTVPFTSASGQNDFFQTASGQVTDSVNGHKSHQQSRTAFGQTASEQSEDSSRAGNWQNLLEIETRDQPMPAAVVENCTADGKILVKFWV